MRPELAVDVPAVRVWAMSLCRTGERIEGDPPPPVTGPAWSATAAHAAAVAAAERVLAALAGDLTGLGRAALDTMDDYEAADDRAVALLRRVR